MASHHVGEKTNHQSERLCEDSDELYQRYDWSRSLEPCRHFWPKDVFPIVFVATELCHHEGTQCEKERYGDVAGHVAASRGKRHQAHEVASEDEEEATEQIGRILLVALSHSRLDDVVFHIRDKHLHEASKSLWRRVARLVAAVPPRGDEYCQQQQHHVDEHRGHCLCY